MDYSLKDKLEFGNDPKLTLTDDVTVTVKSDAKTVLKMMDAVSSKGEVEGALEAIDLLFSAKDRKAIESLNLSMAGFIKVISTAMQMAVGQDPDEENSGE